MTRSARSCQWIAQIPRGANSTGFDADHMVLGPATQAANAELAASASDHGSTKTRSDPRKAGPMELRPSQSNATSRSRSLVVVVFVLVLLCGEQVVVDGTRHLLEDQLVVPVRVRLEDQTLGAQALHERCQIDALFRAGRQLRCAPAGQRALELAHGAHGLVEGGACARRSGDLPRDVLLGLL